MHLFTKFSLASYLVNTLATYATGIIMALINSSNLKSTVFIMQHAISCLKTTQFFLIQMLKSTFLKTTHSSFK